MKASRGWTWLVPALVVALVGRAGGSDDDARAAAADGAFVPGELIVKIADGADARGVARAMGRVGGRRLGAWEDLGLEHWRLGDGAPGVERAVEVLSRDESRGSIEFAEPNWLFHALDVPDDPLRGDLYGLHNVGQTGGVADADIDAPWAWDVSHGSADVVVGVIDTGVDYTHPDLAANVWTNPGEVAGNGLDDDGNGFVDDVRGWDFANDDADPMDDNGHGTHVAGTIGAVGNNGIGVSGVCWNVRILPLKFLGAGGSGSTTDAIDAVKYATGLGVVRITSNSWGGGSFSRSLQRAIEQSGALFVAAAGNGGSGTVSYPAAYPLANVLSVAATDSADGLASFSNWSATEVDLGAPGVDVLSTWRGGAYRLLSGTSMATPHVSGAAALVLARFPNSSVEGMKSTLMATVDPVPSLAGRSLTGGRLNVARAVGGVEPAPGDDATPPDPVLDLAGAPAGEGTVTLTWTATGDDGSTGIAWIFDLRHRTDVPPAGEAEFAAAAKVPGEPLPGPAGTAHAVTVTGLLPGTTYRFALKAVDEAGNSTISNVASVTTSGAPWVVDVVEANDFTGFYNGLAYDPLGEPSVAYEDGQNRLLRFARHAGGAWTAETVDSYGTASAGGLSHRYGPDGEPAVLYVTSSTGPLKFARHAGAGWVLEAVEPDSVSVDRPALAYDAFGRATAAYRRVASGKGKNAIPAGLRFAVRTATGWSVEVVEANAAARYVSMAFDPAGNPAIAYSHDADADGTLDTLRLARKVGGTWMREVVETGTPGFGVLCTLAFDPVTGAPAIATVVSGQVRYAWLDGSTWQSEVVGTGHNGVDLAFAADGTPHVSYRDYTVSPRLVLARRTIGAWTVESVGPSDGRHTSLVFDPLGLPSIAFRAASPTLDVRLARK